MPVTVRLDQKLRDKIDGGAELAVEANSVHQVLFQVAVRYPALHLFNCEGELRSILRIAKNGAAAKVSEPVEDGDTVELSIG